MQVDFSEFAQVITEGNCRDFISNYRRSVGTGLLRVDTSRVTSCGITVRDRISC